MDKFKIFNKENLGSVRTVCNTKTNEIWFVAKDVCDCLGIKNPSQALKRLLESERSSLILNEGTSKKGGNPTFSVVSESGLYMLIMGSRKKEAVEFQRWITREVLPSIRKDGGYILGQEDLPREKLVELKKKLTKLRAWVKKYRNLSRAQAKELEALDDYASTWEKMYETLLKEYTSLIKKEKTPVSKAASLTVESTPKRYSVTKDGFLISDSLWDGFREGQER